MRTEFIEMANELNPTVISLTTRQEHPLSGIKDTHIVTVTDAISQKDILVSGSYYQLNKYLQGIEGQHKHTKIKTVGKYWAFLYS
jgi:hypothetical protein